MTDGQDDRSIKSFIDKVNLEYERLHLAFEQQFWASRMAVEGEDFSTEALNSSKIAMEAFLADSALLQETRRWLSSREASEEEQDVLRMFERTFSCYALEGSEARELREAALGMEASLAAARKRVRVQVKSKGRVMKLSPEQCHVQMCADDGEDTRKLCYKGLRSVGAYVCKTGFAELVQKRNQMARACGYSDFYDYKVTRAEGFSKEKLFQVLDVLEVRTRELLVKTSSALVEREGQAALEPWNTTFMLASDVTKKLDPYFPCENVVDMWMRSYAAMGIRFQDSTLTMDLLARPGKYANAFCHWPRPAWVRPDGSRQPAAANFTSHVNPTDVGSGYELLGGLMHEAGHAAHYANIAQPSPLFSQERAPFSTSYAESQSMFLESLVDDVAWRRRYARDREGRAVPWELLAEEISSAHALAVSSLRRMLELPYFEKALYELPDDELTPERIQEVAAEVEENIGGGPSPWPVLSVSHLLEDEMSCYYHSYVLAQMAVSQMRRYLLQEQGRIIDNPNIGSILAERCWKPGARTTIFEVVEKFTGEPLSSDAWVERLERPLEEVLSTERSSYEEAKEATNGGEVGAQPTSDLEMRVRIVHGDDVIADSVEEGSCAAASARFHDYVAMRRKMLLAAQSGDWSSMRSMCS